LLDLDLPNDQPRVALTILAGEGQYRADLNAKSLRRSITAIHEAGPENVAAILQGRLSGSATIMETGLSVQPKPYKAEP
jgi:hypothetical protein